MTIQLLVSSNNHYTTSQFHNQILDELSHARWNEVLSLAVVSHVANF